MFDLETLDTKPTAVILSLGAVKFDPKTQSVPDQLPKLLLKFDIDAQNDLGRTTSEDTIMVGQATCPHTRRSVWPRG